ncbi:MAG: hypothetical protein HYR66_17830 [Sphingobacteriales bacterium]|nr:hypothetical protein [Sphingobacteriales bacterium]MBI3720080.1 hypothetical protein [Sphingobacteriales bacterium]
MKKFTSLVIITALIFFPFTKASAQATDNPGDYMSAFGKIITEVNASNMAYISQAAHGHRARKLEKMRAKLLETITDSRYKVSALPMYKGDNSLRKESMDHLMFVYNVFNDDYRKIVNMEEIAEQSFDEMEAYILLQEKSEEKIKEANEKMNKAFDDFAAKNKVNLIDNKSELSQKMDDAGKLNKYVNKIYLVFFKCNWEDGKLTEALNAKKLNDVEQARNALIKYANEGLASLDTIKPFANDGSLAAACKRALQFYKKNAEQDVPKQTDYLLKAENFDKIKKAFEAKSQLDRTKEDVDTYNKAVKEINAVMNIANQSGSNANQMRTQVVNGWNEAEKNYSDAHTPYYKK